MSATSPPAPASAANEFIIPTVHRPGVSRQRSSFRAPPDRRPTFPPKYSSVGRRLIGLGLILTVVVLWTASGFLQSAMFADNTYSKPYFIIYINTAFFTLPATPYLIHRSLPRYVRKWIGQHLPGRHTRHESIDEHHTRPHDSSSGYPTSRDPLRGGAGTSNNYDTIEHGMQHRRRSLEPILEDHQVKQQLLERMNSRTSKTSARSRIGSISKTPIVPLTLRETFFLSIRFCFLWYLANYTNAASLHFTSVSSFTILSTTSSIFTLIFGSITGVEAFTLRKLLGVLACLAGVILTSTIEATDPSDDPNRGLFPPKSAKEIFTGDALALFSAVLYGAYCVLLAQRVGDESRITMPLFFGFLGLINITCLWPGFPILDALGIEPFALPPNGRVWGIIIANALSSLVSDLCWAYAVLFTSPLVVTVGLSLTIPLSLVGQIVLDGQYASAWYWVGATIVVMSFVFVNYESAVDAKVKDEDAAAAAMLEEEEEEEEQEVNAREQRAEEAAV